MSESPRDPAPPPQSLLQGSAALRLTWACVLVVLLWGALYASLRA